MPITTFLNGRTDYIQLRGMAFMALSEVGYVVAGSVTSDAGGGGTTTWVAGTVGIPCRVDALGGGESVTAGQISENSTHQITLPAATPIDEVNRFAITGRGTFDITAVPERTGEFLRVLEAVQS